jgi:predicted enzyme related to lactoylglutathione lyase
MRLRALIYCVDIRRLAAFYEDLLPLAAVVRSPDYIDYGIFALHSIPQEIVESMSLRASSKPRENGSTKLIFEVPDPAALRSKLEAGGHQILDRPWGSWDAVDPEGNVFAVIEESR